MDARINGCITIETIGDAMELAERLVELRTGASLTQEGLGEALGVSRQAVSKWERGESMPDVVNLIALSKLYNTTVNEILGGELKDHDCDEEKGFSMHFGVRCLTDEEIPESDPADEHVVSHSAVKAVALFVLVVAAVILQSLFAENAWFILVPAGMALITLALNIYDWRKDDAPASFKTIAGLFPMCWVLVSTFVALGFIGGMWNPSWLVLLIEIPWIALMRLKTAKLTIENA